MTDENVGRTRAGQLAGPSRVDRTRAMILNKPPEPSQEAIDERERCIAGTHSDAGPMPLQGASRRGEPMTEPNVPPTELGEPSEG